MPDYYHIPHWPHNLDKDNPFSYLAENLKRKEVAHKQIRTRSLDDGPERIREEIIDYEGLQVIVFQNEYPGGQMATVVPGQIVRCHYRAVDAAFVSEVSPLPPDKRPNLESLLREKRFQGPLNFWD